MVNKDSVGPGLYPTYILPSSSKTEEMVDDLFGPGPYPTFILPSSFKTMPLTISSDF